MYLYLPANFPPEDLPEQLRKLTGTLTFAMDLSLTADRKLARADVNVVIAALQPEAVGYYLQMPPKPLQPRLAKGAQALTA